VSYGEEAESWFDPGRPDPRIREWGPAVEFRRGQPGFCWHNARQLARSAPSEFVYAEGVAFIYGEWQGHGWVVRRANGEVVECTAGFGAAERYRGICLEIADVEAFIDSRPLVDGLTLRQRMRNYDATGDLISEAPGVLAILAEERVCRGRIESDYLAEGSTWLDSGVDPMQGRSRPDGR